MKTFLRVVVILALIGLLAWIFWIFHDLLEDLVLLAAIFYPVVFLGIVIGLIVLLVIGIKKLFEEV